MTEPPRRKPTHDDLRAAVIRQIGFLTKSINAVQTGDNDEALRVAQALRVLLHDTKRSRSLLGQIGWKDGMQFISTVRPLETSPTFVMSLMDEDGEQLGIKYGLVKLIDDAVGQRHIAAVDRGPSPELQDFNIWWNEKMLWNDVGPAFSRWDLVDAMVHTDGGAHVDPRGVREDYADFKLHGTGGLYADLPPGVTDFSQLEGLELKPIGDAASPTVAQIGYELIESLRDANNNDLIWAG